ncbi:MAG: hypothetical protein IT531_00115 [Burkholderiales bacterium]|nr:hypothetical protein [Burkholderiales bacterium]
MTALSVLAALSIVAQCICAANQMDAMTHHGIRAVYLLLAVSALAAALAPLYGASEPSYGDTSVLIMTALYLVVNRRRGCCA